MTPAVELAGIDKRFGAVHANKAVSLAVAPGTVHGIIGENGAGKSTLMSILYGFYEADAGEIQVEGRPVRIRSSADAIAAGIGMVHQHFMLVDTMSVVENVMLGAEGGAFTRAAREKARNELLRMERTYGLEVDPDATVGALSVGQQQRVEILKALYRGARILILDEPTGVLTPSEADQLFEVLAGLKAQGRTILFITHKLREIMAITDAVSVMRRGEMVATLPTAATTREELAELMVGRRVAPPPREAGTAPGPVLLSVRGLSVVDHRGVTRVADASFDVRGGEIVGIAGVSGNGQSELIEAITGLVTPSAGSVSICGEPVPRAGGVPAVRALSLAHVPEDRHRTGLVTAFRAFESAILGRQDERRLRLGAFIDQRAAVRDTQEKMQGYEVRPPDPLLKTANFSGGNQQKIVLAREFEADPAVLVIAQPTRGVDIGAIEFIHRRIMDLRRSGKAILLVSVELDEIFALADRILVMCAGRIVGEREAATADQREIGLMLAGVTTGEGRPA